jgi:hypothetical protein
MSVHASNMLYLFVLKLLSCCLYCYLFIFNCSVSLYAYYIYMIYMIHMFYVLMIHIVMDIFDIMISLINHLLLGECPCVTTGTYNNIITYIQNVSYIVIGKCFIIHL